MPENPGNYRAIPPVTIVTVSPAGLRVAQTKVGSAPAVHMTAELVQDPDTLARAFTAMQKQVSHMAAQQTSDPHSGRVILKDIQLVAATPLAILHGLQRPFVGWAWNHARIAAPSIFELPATVAQPAKSFLILQSAVTCTIDLEVW